MREISPFFVFIFMSSFTEQPIKILLAVAESLMDSKFDYNNPWKKSEENYELLDQSSAWIGISVEYEDMEFMAALLKQNEETLTDYINGKISRQDAISRIQKPKIKKFKIWYEIWGPATLTEQYNTVWESFDEKWAEDSLKFHYYDGSFDYFQGEYVGHESDDFEADNFQITDSKVLGENKKAILDKLVVENTENLLDNLDRDTLIHLRNLINRKLSS